MDILLEVKGLTTEFNSSGGMVRAVDDVSFNLFKAEVIGVVGESGSGKSVTSLSIMQLIEQSQGRSAGSVVFNGPHGSIDLFTLAEKQKRTYRGKDIAMIFQEPMTSLNPVLTCGYQVAEALRLHLHMTGAEAKQRTIELFIKVKLPRPEDIYNSYPHQLSGGQKQRVMIAMAISCNPSILIADEPTTALDVTVQASILQLLKEIQKETCMSIIFITHDLGVISGIAERILVMYKGKIVEQGSVKDIFTRPQHPYTRGLLACRPLLHTRASRLPVISDFLQTDSSGNMTELVSVFETNIPVPDKNINIYNAEPLINVEHLSVHYPVKGGFFGKTKGVVKAVDDVSFKVFKGETLGLVGESGCGKTTLGRSVLKLISNATGKVIYKGKNVLEMDERDLRPLRKNLQIIFQDPYSSLNPRLTAGEAITEPMKVHHLHGNERSRKEAAMDLLRKVNLKEEHYYRYPHEFSGGQRQRIGIARALSLNPEFIICDESVSALDVSVQAQVLNLLNDLKREFGFTYIFISHDLSIVKYMSDRLIVMNKGIIEEEGEPEAIYRSPKSEYTRRLIEAIPAINF
jgi:peptide/nickel transport system ATP-binding protein